MNMKKTIAAIAAGAVAVSAMATTVSALADTSLAYNLVTTMTHTKVEETPATATYEFTVNGATSALASVDFVSPETVQSVVVKVASSEAGEQNKIFTYSTDINALNYNKLLVPGATSTLTFQKELEGYTGNLTLTITVNCESSYDSVAAINTAIDAGTITSATTGATPIVCKAYTAAEKKETKTDYFVPFKTEIKNNENITAFLENKGYHNVGAVLNDAIENYETVTFTFNTAANGIGYTVAGGDFVAFDRLYGRAGDGWAPNDDNVSRRYEEAVSDAYSTSWAPAEIIAFYTNEWWADNSYKSFDQHLYQGTNNVYGTYITSYGSEATGYTGFDWTGYNLFQGALVINENLTMSLAETDYFDWTATSLSFDWDAIMDGAMTSNDYAVYLHSMKLATSNTWYWDNMTVTLTAGAADDVEAEAGVEADDEELEEEVVEEEVVEEVEEEVEVEVANPTTGNASVALAVIPVALAAAAVIAKKRS